MGETREIPTDERIRSFYVHATGWSMIPASERPDLARLREANAAEFDAWLADHDEKVRAAALAAVTR